MQDRELEERVRSALEEAKLTRRSLLRRGVVFGAGLTALPAIAAACGGDESSSSGATGTGGGLSGMNERAELLGGQLVVKSNPGAGTRLRAALPLDAPTGDRVDVETAAGR